MKTTYTNEELKAMDENNGMTALEMFYTGGGIYCFVGKIAENVYICGSSDGYSWFVDERPTAEEFGNVEWQEVHQVYEPTNEESTEWTYGTIALFIDRVKNGMMGEILPTSNYSLSELERILESLSKGLCLIDHTEPECIQATDQERTKGMGNLRIIEISDGCMGGDSALYLTDAPDTEIKELCERYKEDDQTDFMTLAKRYFFKQLVGTEETCDYAKVKGNFNVFRVFTIY